MYDASMPLIHLAVTGLALIAPIQHSEDDAVTCEENFAFLADATAWCASQAAQQLAEAKPVFDDMVNPPPPAPGGIEVGQPVQGVPLPRGVALAIDQAFPEHLEAEAVSVARCESGFDPAARSRISSATGLFQFVNRTWRWVADELGLTDRRDAFQNAEAAAHLVNHTIRVERRSPWAHWGCQP